MIKFNSVYYKFLHPQLRFFKAANTSLAYSFNKFQFKNFYFQEEKHGAGDYHIVAKRVIKVVSRTLKEIDPHRWEGIPITFETQWNFPDNPLFDIRTSILIHDALEKEFNIDIDDKKMLLTNIKDSVNFILENHAAV